MIRFCEVLEDCHLGDLDFFGSCFTWSNRRLDNSFTKERLDRAVANPEWCSIFPKVSVLVLAARTSDHSPLVISFDEDGYERKFHMRGFKFEAWWTNDVECSNIINSAWNEDMSVNVSISNVRECLSACQYALKGWSSRKFGNLDKLIKQKTTLLENLQKRESPSLVTQIRSLQKEIDELLECEEMRWKQRAKQHWLRNGDRNTAFFHSWAQYSFLSFLSRDGFGGKKGILAESSLIIIIDYFHPKDQTMWRNVLDL